MLTHVITCVSGTSGVQGVCPEGLVQVVQEAYLIPASEANTLKFLFGELDPVQASQIFGFSLATTVGFWLAAWGIGTVARMVRN